MIKRADIIDRNGNILATDDIETKDGVGGKARQVTRQSSVVFFHC